MSTSDAPRLRLGAARYGQTFSREDFGGASLVSVALRDLVWFDRCRFVGADLRQATLGGACFKLCDLAGADLRAASLRGASFMACDLTGADLRGADLTGTRFGTVGTGRGATPTRLTGARFDPGALEALDGGGFVLD